MAEEDGIGSSGGVQSLSVADDEAGLRLDRWFRRHFPELSHGRLEKLLRTGQVRVDGRRAKAGQRLVAEQQIRVPPLGAQAPKGGRRALVAPVDPEDAEALRSAVLYRDDLAIAINKPAGLAVQGGTRTLRHLDGMLEALRFEKAEAPRLVHRLDRDTSGVLVLARSAAAAARLAKAFQMREAQKLYWAITVGTPTPHVGRIDRALAKVGGPGGERMAAVDGTPGGRRAVTLYKVSEHAGRRAALVALAPLTGRTHQLRAHLAAIGTPVVGDGKYGGADAFLPGRSRKLQLHARRLILPLGQGRRLDVTAPPPEHMVETFRFFGFDPSLADTMLVEDE